MASVAKSDTITLVANTAQSTTLTQYWDVVEAVNHSTSDIVYVRADGTAATVAGDNCEVVLPGERLSIRVQWDYTLIPGAASGAISAISAGTPNVTIVGA